MFIFRLTVINEENRRVERDIAERRDEMASEDARLNKLIDEQTRAEALAAYTGHRRVPGS
jgi:hypothetical protein